MNYYFDDLSLSTLWIPFFEPNEMPDDDQQWAISMDPIPDTIAVGDDLIPTQMRLESEEPEYSWENGQYGLKLTKQTNQTIFDLIYYYRWDPMGVLVKQVIMTPTLVVFEIRKKHFRDQVWGASFSKILNKFILRGELAYHIDKYFQTENPNDTDALTKKDYLNSCLGLEYTLGDEFYMNLLVNNKTIIDYESFISQRRSETIVFGIIDRFLDRKTMRARLLFYYNIDDGDSRVNPELSYELGDGLRAYLGIEFINGNTSTDWGQFDDNDLIYLRVKYSF